jgi:hypothetical protein
MQRHRADAVGGATGRIWMTDRFSLDDSWRTRRLVVEKWSLIDRHAPRASACAEFFVATIEIDATVRIVASRRRQSVENLRAREEPRKEASDEPG